MKVVISQSMLFPWVGLLEQVNIADVFVHYDDVQFSKGSFVNRVQLKMPEGIKWMTVPLKQLHLGQRINEIQIPPSSQWREKHFDLLKRSLGDAPYVSDAMKIMEIVYAVDYPHLGALASASMLSLVNYFGIDAKTRFVDVTTLDIEGSSSDRVLNVVKSLHGDVYVTGHGAARYLKHEQFERDGIQVEYIDYRLKPYPQSNGPFTPYVSGLDLVAHCGRGGIEFILSKTLPWRKFVHEPH